jgi:MFS family permease
MTLAGLGCALGCAAFAWSTTLAMLAAGRLLIGAAAAFSLVGAMAVAGQWFPPRRFALLSGIAMMMGMFGGVAGQAPMRLIVERTDWRTAVLVTAVGGVLIAVASLAVVRDRRRGSGGIGAVLGGFGTVARNPQTWLIAVAGLGTTASLIGFAGLWGVPFLAAVQGISQAEAASITSAMFLGWAAGAPLLGWLSDRIGRRRLPFVMGLVLCTLALAALVHAPVLTPVGAAVLCGLCGLGGSVQIIGFAAVREHNPARLSGTAIGIVNSLVTGAGALYQPLLGWLLDLGWTGEMAAGARVYDTATYRAAFSVLIAGSALGAVCALLMRETWCRPSEARAAGG